MAAIKEGDLDVKYDAPFVFAEVNADIIHWLACGDGRRLKVSGCRTAVQLVVKVTVKERWTLF